MKKILIATTNENKLKELKNLLQPLGYETLSLKDLKDDDEVYEDGTTFEENANLKAVHYFVKYHMPVIADDSGISIEYLGYHPGIKSSRFLSHLKTCERNQMIVDLMKGVKNRNAFYTCNLVYLDSRNYKSFESRLCGVINDEIVGENGFGYDPIFYLEEYDKTFAQIDENIREKISHRSLSLKKLVAYLEKI